MTLTQAAKFTKRGTIVFFLLIFLGISGKLGYSLWQQYYLSTLPPIPEKAENKFGALPKLVFPPSSVSSSNFSYSIDTTTGGLPQTPKFIKIYFIPRANISLLAPEKSRELANLLGFNSPPKIISDTKQEFSDNNNGNISIDLTSGNFSFQRKLEIIPQEASSSNTLPDQTQLVTIFKEYLSSKSLLPEELKNGRSNVVFDGPTVIDSSSANISLWPNDFNDLPIITSSFTESLVKAMITLTKEGTFEFISMDYSFWPIDPTTYSTYEIKTAEEALRDLQAGQGFISIEPKNPKVSLTSAYLAYFQTSEYTPYLQPVFVFEGPNFAALVSAIRSF